MLLLCADLQPSIMNNYKRELFVFCFVFFFVSFSSSQTVLIPFRQGSLWGYADTNGVIQIKPAFDKAAFFNYSQQFTQVFKDGKVSLIDHQGKTLFPFSDRYQHLAGVFVVALNGKQGIYSEQGVQLVAPDYDNLKYAALYQKYRDESHKHKFIGRKGAEYFLVDVKSSTSVKIPKPINSHTSDFSVDVVEPIDESNLTSAPWPQLKSREFEKLKGYSNLVHCETIYQNGKPVFHVFCSWKDRKMVGYIGRNGVVFYKD